MQAVLPWSVPERILTRVHGHRQLPDAPRPLLLGYTYDDLKPRAKGESRGQDGGCEEWKANNNIRYLHVHLIHGALYMTVHDCRKMIANGHYDCMPGKYSYAMVCGLAELIG